MSKHLILGTALSKNKQKQVNLKLCSEIHAGKLMEPDY